MKIAAVGKGGSGKTTIAGTLARIFASYGRKILAIDGDPNPNLALMLGMSRPAADRLIYIPSNVMRRVNHADGSHSLEPSEPRPDIMRKYAAHAADNVDLIVMGKPAHGTAGSGCMCASHRAVRGLIAELTDFGEHTITDMEAGLEHLKRGTARHVDMMLIVAEPYYRSLEAASRTAELAAELKIPYIKVVANKVRSADDRQAIELYCRQHKIDIIGVVPYDNALIEAERGGQAPVDFAPNSEAITAIREIATQITELVSAAAIQPAGIGSVQGTRPGC
jgi:CO dehydrogenase maturation factor